MLEAKLWMTSETIKVTLGQVQRVGLGCSMLREALAAEGVGPDPWWSKLALGNLSLCAQLRDTDDI